MESRKQMEKEFHDKIRTINDDDHVSDTRWSPELEQTIENNPLWSNMKYYAIERRSREMVQKWFRDNCKGKRVLDYCCGNGEDSLYIAQNGAVDVLGIDLSEISIENCRRQATQQEIRNTTYYVRDAENTGFPDNSFDIVTEYGALHHLELDKALCEITRILKPGGKVICNEALGHNVLIHLYRKLTPQLRTPWEVDHIVRRKDLSVLHTYFGRVEIRFFHLFTLLAVPFRKYPFFPILLSFLEKIDSLILRIPLVKWQAWQAVFVLSEPKKIQRR